jgi:hypothetical protein
MSSNVVLAMTLELMSVRCLIICLFSILICSENDERGQFTKKTIVLGNNDSNNL